MKEDQIELSSLPSSGFVELISTTAKTSAEEGLQTCSPTMLLGLFKNVTECVLDPTKVVQFWTPHARAFFYVCPVERYSFSVGIGNMLAGNTSLRMSSVC